MAFKHVLKSIRDPKIQLKEMSIWDDSETRNNTKSDDITILRTSDSFTSNEHTVGRDTPYVQIGEFTVSENGLIELVIDETEFIPTIKVVFIDERHGFKDLSFPKANPIISIYIKPPNKKLKPIRNDYLISSIRQIGEEWIVSGELFIPKIYQNVSKSYPKMNSKNALDKLCEELGLGFQTNDFDLDDNMTWINPNWDSYSFMKHVIKHAYQDDDSFFGAFIDKYYHLTMVNINLQLEYGGDIDKTIFSGVDTEIKESMKGDTPAEDNIIANMLLKYPGYNVGANAIIGYDLLTEHGDILIQDGYRKRIYYYDHLDSKTKPKDKMVNFYMRPILSTGAPEYSNDLEPEDEDLKTGEVRKWMNIDYGNTHEQYNSASLVNYHNARDIEKITLRVGVSGINFNVTKGQRIPVGIFDTMAEATAKRSQDSTESKEAMKELSNDSSIVFDEFISGTYYVSGTKYTYEDGKYSTLLYLSRRDWKPVPSKSTSTTDTNNTL